VIDDWLPLVPAASIVLALGVAWGAQERTEVVVALQRQRADIDRHGKEVERLDTQGRESLDAMFEAAEHCESLWEKHKLRCVYDMVHSPGSQWLRDRVAVECPRCTLVTRFANAD
tara:strand:- start:6233 stop:6577 length:345 start_codon:yes stop_codon:yes gene_type:complete